SALLKRILLNISMISNSKILSIKRGLRSISTPTTSLSVFKYLTYLKDLEKSQQIEKT
ncbi:22224_t:CDS:1, partial [Dentiscutata erythropus]